jgi:hypothetical protein
MSDQLVAEARHTRNLCPQWVSNLRSHQSSDCRPHALSYGCIGARNDTTQQSGQTPVKEVKLKNITIYVSSYTETDTTGMLSPPTVWRQQSEFVSSRQSGQILAAVCIGFECRCNGQNGCRFKCSHAFLQCIPRQMLVCCVVLVLAPLQAVPLQRTAIWIGQTFMFTSFTVIQLEISCGEVTFFT